MENFLENVLAGLLPCIIILIVVVAMCSCDSTYKMSGYIENGYVIDETGEAWIYNSPYKNGVEVEITFNTNCTDSRYDDKIYKITPKN